MGWEFLQVPARHPSQAVPAPAVRLVLLHLPLVPSPVPRQAVLKVLVLVALRSQVPVLVRQRVLARLLVVLVLRLRQVPSQAVVLRLSLQVLNHQVRPVRLQAQNPVRQVVVLRVPAQAVVRVRPQAVRSQVQVRPVRNPFHHHLLLVRQIVSVQVLQALTLFISANIKDLTFLNLGLMILEQELLLGAIQRG